MESTKSSLQVQFNKSIKNCTLEDRRGIANMLNRSEIKLHETNDGLCFNLNLVDNETLEKCNLYLLRHSNKLNNSK